jgi:hypothetical protein
MTEIRLIGSSREPERQLWIARIDELTDARLSVDESMKPWVAFVALDATRYRGEELCAFARTMLDQGCVYACAWGPDSGRVEDCFDEEDVAADMAGQPYASVVMTTAHQGESLDEALWFSIFVASPADAPARAVIALSEAKWLDQIRARLADSERLRADVIDGDGDRA